ncbi:MAG: hypothetical protein KAT16_02740 [Candidatus Heimdallarchaeota archaeon]|nr:hypothetical protein [Candidatus Heimdallarchaeota archaeon]
MFRQNTVLNDFVNFLKARGRFRDIEFIENSVHATPRIPGFPTIIFYIEETQADPKDLHYILEIHGTESSVMNREIREFFGLNELRELKIRVKFHLKANFGEDLTVEIEGTGTSLEKFTEKLEDLISTNQLTIEKTQKTLIFSKKIQKEVPIPRRPTQVSQKVKPVIRASPSKISPVKVMPKRTSPNIIPPTISKPLRRNLTVNEVSKSSTVVKEVTTTNIEVEGKDDPLINDISDDFDEEALFREAPKQDKLSSSVQSSNHEADLFKMKPPDRSYSTDVKPYLKQSRGLFRKDNWEEDLPTETEMEILDRTFARIKHRTKPEILAKDLDIPIEESEKHLRNLISKGLLRTQVGWFIIKKSHLPFFKEHFANGNKKKKKKKSPRISRTGEGLTPEEISTIKAIKSRPNLKAQSNLLTRPTGLKQSILKEVLRNLVDKSILRVSYGWYILKDKHILEQKRGSSQSLGKTTIKSTELVVPKGYNLTKSEVDVIQALLQRPQFKAQSNLLTSEVKLSKDQIKQVLRDLVEKEICKVTYGWYALKNPNQFQDSSKTNKKD